MHFSNLGLHKFSLGYYCIILEQFGKMHISEVPQSEDASQLDPTSPSYIESGTTTERKMNTIVQSLQLLVLSSVHLYGILADPVACCINTSVVR